MNVIVLVKQVPDAAGGVVINPDGTLDRSRMQAITNPADLGAMEAGLKIGEQTQGTVCAMTMGPAASESMLRELLVMGADEAVLISDRKFSGSDTYATSLVLAAAIREFGLYDDTVVLCGQYSIDGGTAQVGPEVAEKLNIPQVTSVSSIHPEEDGLLCKRIDDHGFTEIKIHTPCLVSCNADVAEPRYMNVLGIKNAYSKPLRIYDYGTIKDNPVLAGKMTGQEGSPTVVLASIPVENVKREPEFFSADRVGCAALAGVLINAVGESGR